MTIPISTAAAPVAVSVGASATLIAAAAASRKGLVVANNGSATVYLGLSGVTTAAGLPLVAGEKAVFSADFVFAGALYGIAASGTCDVRVWQFT